MLIFLPETTRPYYHIAAEEYLLRNYREDICIFWRSEPSLVVGKHQNALAEVNYAWLWKNRVPLVRRISGGGTVYHDMGNVNFTFIQNGSEGHLIDFARYTRPIVKALQNLGLDVKLEGKNDLRLNGFKISGNAGHVYKKRVLHHGTLLYDTGLDQLRQALQIHPGRYQDKAVKSIPSPVANITDFLSPAPAIDQFISYLVEQIQEMFTGAYVDSFSVKDKEAIAKLVREKFETWEWNYAYSPAYRLVESFRYEETCYQINLQVKKGVIQRCEIKPRSSALAKLEEVMIGKQHRMEVLQALLYQNVDKQAFAECLLEHLF